MDLIKAYVLGLYYFKKSSQSLKYEAVLNYWQIRDKYILYKIQKGMRCQEMNSQFNKRYSDPYEMKI